MSLRDARRTSRTARMSLRDARRTSRTARMSLRDARRTLRNNTRRTSRNSRRREGRSSRRFTLSPHPQPTQRTPQRHRHECLRRTVLPSLVDDSEPADTIVRRLMVGFVHPWTELHGTMVLALDHLRDDARDVAGIIDAALELDAPHAGIRGPSGNRPLQPRTQCPCVSMDSPSVRLRIPREEERTPVVMVDRQDVNTWLRSVNCLVRVAPIATARNRVVIDLVEEVINGIHRRSPKSGHT